MEEVGMESKDLDLILEGRRSQPHQLIEVLQDIQEQFGYISREAMTTISKELGVPLMEVYSVASFYKAFSLKPRGKNVITICTGTACHVRGSNLILSQAAGQLDVEPGEMTSDGQFTIENVNCVGACALAPVVTENGNCHHHMSPAKLRKMIKTLERKHEEGISND